MYFFFRWRIADQDYESLFDKCSPMRDTSHDSDAEDMSEEAVQSRHDRCEHDEKKRFLSYLKLPLGHGRQRSHKRTDSRAESSGANTPDPMSPHSAPPNNGVTASAASIGAAGGAAAAETAQEGAGAASASGSPMVSPPATPQSLQLDDTGPLPSIAVMRRRTMSACRWGQTSKEEEATDGASTAAVEEVAPYDRRTFPITEDLYEQMIESTPENHQLQTNTSAQDSTDFETYSGYLAAGSSRKTPGAPRAPELATLTPWRTRNLPSRPSGIAKRTRTTPNGSTWSAPIGTVTRDREGGRGSPPITRHYLQDPT
ncbi:unnamed protein product [Acanthoscelides obtectus]|uniref:PEHE domain-containing protein n=1 Tax=Acanthoscelides obtectus TaxID=200917 RepID=A0A9P0KGI4_ACAOB|nr:unnamed protein product [Acanthoscelides obtectus]CAK1664723.1 hypothetical protein AOBTE_LOCUS24433 [Acanthoscelides obtectus]